MMDDETTRLVWLTLAEIADREPLDGAGEASDGRHADSCWFCGGATAWLSMGGVAGPAAQRFAARKFVTVVDHAHQLCAHNPSCLWLRAHAALGRTVPVWRP